MKISCIAVDDEPLALEKIKSFVGKLPDLKLMATFRNGAEALEYMRKNEVHILFLDIQMDKMTGIEMLEQLTNRPQVIFTTAYSEYALRGFELSVTDYVLKPFTFERFANAVNKAAEYIRWKKEILQPVKETADYIFVKSGYELVKIVQNDIS